MDDGDSMDLICFKYDGWQPRIRPGAPRRAWMDATNERYAYRCLPLTIANSHGWELLSPMAFEAKWDGGDHMESLEIRMDRGYAEHLKPVSIFGYGTITWHVEAIFRTPPGWNLHVSGPPNRQKDGIQPLGGIIETDWSPYTFTMNWRFTRPDHWVRFEENEPIAFFFPVERGRAERFKPRIERLEDHDELRAAFEKWSASRNAFQKWVMEANPDAPAEKWQKLYFRGLDADGAPGVADHQSKLRLPHFVHPDGRAMDPGEEKTCPVHRRPEPAAQPPANLLLNPAQNAATANPGLALALGRLGFDAEKAAPQREAPPPRDPAAEVALRRRDWILEAQAKQLALSSRRRAIERVRDLEADAFLEHFYAPARPVIIEGALDSWPALGRWTPDYLAASVGTAEVEVQGTETLMPFDAFVAEAGRAAFGNELSLDSESAAARAALACLEADTRPVQAYLKPGAGRLWMGSAGTFLPLRLALENRMIAVATGAMHVILLPASETRRLYDAEGAASAVHDVTDETQLARYPLARGARMFEFDVEPGDLLFVPVGWWHQATALDFSVTVSHSNFRWPNAAARDFPGG